MSDNSYKKSVSIKSTSALTFMALTKELGQWWGQMDTKVEQEGVIFTVSWGQPWYTFKVTSYQPSEELMWECIDANQIIEGLEEVQKEWVGTTLKWVIEPIEGHKTRVTLEHLGLTPAFICYDFCSSTWDHFIGIKLKEYLENL